WLRRELRLGVQRWEEWAHLRGRGDGRHRTRWQVPDQLADRAKRTAGAGRRLGLRRQSVGHARWSAERVPTTDVHRCLALLNARSLKSRLRFVETRRGRVG